MKRLQTYLYGDWGRFYSYLNRLKTIEGRMSRILNEIGHEIELRVKSNIETQMYVGYGIPPASPETMERKDSDLTQIDSWNFVDNIKVFDIAKEEGKLVIWVGADNSITEPNTGISLGQLAEIFEMGSSDGKIPPRPIFTLTWKEMQREIPPRIMEKLSRELRYGDIDVFED